MDQDGKIRAADGSARRQELVFLAALFFGSIFALVNFIFAFYNLFHIVNTVARTLKGMRMKINLAEKALKERRLPSNLMGKTDTFN
ncbi:hypothetical protein Y032_0247g46 [Ancylostoma ceylanicum]|uniref:Uncharacterized protein n=1 Tax=Ancylostoma ceylanicum TaxID=53326 RepID=A0A016SDG0_9BILA|nr:hypothetical protein Y032_0247g46 [Ancylostoma ceylanicum]